jgi:L-lactate dehydrogenase complex protein LldE
MKKKVYIFPTCIGRVVYKTLIKRVYYFLKEKNFEVSVLKTPFCCGQVFLNSGMKKESKRIANVIVNNWKNKNILVFSGSCTEYILKKIPFLSHKPLNFSVKEITEFFMEEGFLKNDILYHTSCHYKILKKEAQEFMDCCGFGGVFSVIYPSLSQKILIYKFGENSEILSIEPGCSLNINTIYNAKHPLELIFKKE